MGMGGDRLAGWALRNRRLVRAPIWLYRHGFGALMGSRVLMLEHVGRKSGQPRYVCLEVVERQDPDSFILVSGFGPKSQWYRNLLAHPQCWVTIGRDRRRPARAEALDEEEAAAVLACYRTTHPKAWLRLRGAIEQATGHQPVSLPMMRVRRS